MGVVLVRIIDQDVASIVEVELSHATLNGGLAIDSAKFVTCFLGRNGCITEFAVLIQNTAIASSPTLRTSMTPTPRRMSVVTRPSTRILRVARARLASRMDFATPMTSRRTTPRPCNAQAGVRSGVDVRSKCRSCGSMASFAAWPVSSCGLNSFVIASVHRLEFLETDGV